MMGASSSTSKDVSFFAGLMKLFEPLNRSLKFDLKECLLGCPCRDIVIGNELLLAAGLLLGQAPLTQ